MATHTVRRKQVRDLTFKLLTEHGLTGWRVRFNPRLTRALGRCNHTDKVIDYQPRYMKQNDWEQVKSTILHEVAHAMAGPYAGHGWTWQQYAKGLGLENPSAVSYTAKLTRKFTGTCPGCSYEWQRDRRAIGAVCPPCRRLHLAGETERRYTINWTRND